MTQSYAAIEDAMKLYFDGFYNGDISTLKQVFHPRCHLYSATEGKVVDDDMSAVYTRVENREAPAKRNEVRSDRIISIHFSDSLTALATVEIGIGDKLFTDYLNFICIDGRWQIIAKVYTFVMRQAAVHSQAAD